MKREQIEKGIAAIFEETGIAKAARENNFAEYLQDAMMRLVEWAFTSHKVLNVPDTKRDEIIKQLANYKSTLIIGEPLSPWISVEERLPSVNNNGESKMVFVRVINKDTKAEWIEQPAKYNINIKDWIAMDFTHIGKRNGIVTHWMEIPKIKEE